MKYLNLLSAALLIGAVACTEEKIESSSPTLGEMGKSFLMRKLLIWKMPEKLM